MNSDQMVNFSMVRNLFLVLLVLGFPIAGYTQADKKEVRSGTSRYEQGKYADAELDFRKALEKNASSYAGTYNLGNSLYKQEKQDEAAARFAEAAERAADPEEKARALHNLGNAQIKAQKYQEAVEAYKKSLKLNPSDNDTRYNLAYAQTMLKKQQEQQQQQGKDQQQNKDQNQNQNQNKDQQDQKDQQNQDQSADNNDQQKDKGKEGQKQPQPKISKEDAERILQALKNNEQELNKKLSRKEGERVNVEKNW